ncbi:MAG: hypothetical protein R3C05_05650 [Pirellulaceae bacterium]
MWIDYVRVYAKEPVDSDYSPELGVKPQLATSAVGLNFQVESDMSTRLRPNITAGADDVSQRNWNNLIGPSGSESRLTNDRGEILPHMSASWSVPSGDQAWRSRTAREWGFKNGNLTMQTGFIQLGGKLDVEGVPFEKYDVYVYLGAGDQGGAGSVTLTNADATGADSSQTHFYKLGWFEGKFKISVATKPQDDNEGNVVVFKGNNAKSIQLNWTGNLSGGWTGVTAIQIVEAP